MYKNVGVSNAIEACPRVINSAPITTAFLYPILLSANQPPTKGVK